MADEEDEGDLFESLEQKKQRDQMNTALAVRLVHMKKRMGNATQLNRMLCSLPQIQK
jgi:hypothetical protein